MSFQKQDTYKSEEYFRLDFSESSDLYLFLTVYFSEIDSKLTHLIHKKFELLRLLLYAHFGVKPTLFGIKKTDPYKMNDQEDVEKKFRKINSDIKSSSVQSIRLYDIYVRLSKYLIYSYDENNGYKTFVVEKDKMHLKYLKEEFDNFGIEKNLDDYIKLIKYYS